MKNNIKPLVVITLYNLPDDTSTEIKIRLNKVVEQLGPSLDAAGYVPIFSTHTLRPGENCETKFQAFYPSDFGEIEIKKLQDLILTGEKLIESEHGVDKLTEMFNGKSDYSAGSKAPIIKKLFEVDDYLSIKKNRVNEFLYELAEISNDGSKGRIYFKETYDNNKNKFYNIYLETVYYDLFVNTSKSTDETIDKLNLRLYMMFENKYNSGAFEFKPALSDAEIKIMNDFSNNPYKAIYGDTSISKHEIIDSIEKSNTLWEMTYTDNSK